MAAHERLMVALEQLRYVRLVASDLGHAADFAQHVLGLEPIDRTEEVAAFRSDFRDYTLAFATGSHAVQAVGLEVRYSEDLDAALEGLRRLGVSAGRGSAEDCALRKVKDMIWFNDFSGNRIELVVRPERSGRRYFASRDAGITCFSHIGLNSTDPARDERFWTQVCNARVSDRIGDIPLMRVNAIHHTIALVRAPKAGIQHINHQVETSDDVLRSYYFLNERRVPIVFGPGRHPTSGARFLYFRGPDGMIFEYSVGVDEIEDEATHRPRQFGFEPTSFCMWGAKPAGMPLPNS